MDKYIGRLLDNRYEILERITEGKGTMEDLDTLEELAEHIKGNALCGLGQTAPNPVLSTIKYFRDEYEAHIYEKRCPAHHCQKLLNYVITGKCRGCTACTKVCPAGAISGTVKEQHKIDTTKCLKCGACMEKCKFGAISEQNSERVWPLVDEGIQCWHGDLEFQDMLNSLVDFSTGHLSEPVKSELAERMLFDSKNGRGALRRKATTIVENLS